MLPAVSLLAAIALIGHGAPTAKHCVSADESRAHVAGDDGGGGGEEAAPTFSAAFYARTFTLDSSLDGVDGKQLPVSIEQVCDLPASLSPQAAQLAGADGVA